MDESTHWANDRSWDRYSYWPEPAPSETEEHRHVLDPNHPLPDLLDSRGAIPASPAEPASVSGELVIGKHDPDCPHCLGRGSVKDDIGNVWGCPVCKGGIICDCDKCRLRTLTAEVERLKADAARLDWLESRYGLHKSAEILYVVDGYVVTLTDHDGTEQLGCYEGATLREAIDAATPLSEREKLREENEEYFSERLKALEGVAERMGKSLEDLAGAGEEAWGSDRPCVEVALAALAEYAAHKAGQESPTK